MLFTSEIIDDMIDEINQNLMPENCSAIRGFDTKDLPIPLKKTYLSFIPEKNTVSYFEDDVRELCQKSEATIRMTCFSPLVPLILSFYLFRCPFSFPLPRCISQGTDSCVRR